MCTRLIHFERCEKKDGRGNTFSSLVYTDAPSKTNEKHVLAWELYLSRGSGTSVWKSCRSNRKTSMSFWPGIFLFHRSTRTHSQKLPLHSCCWVLLGGNEIRGVSFLGILLGKADDVKAGKFKNHYEHFRNGFTMSNKSGGIRRRKLCMAHAVLLDIVFQVCRILLDRSARFGGAWGWRWIGGMGVWRGGWEWC